MGCVGFRFCLPYALAVLPVEKDCGIKSKVDKLKYLEVGLLKLRLVLQVPGGKQSALSYQECAGDIPNLTNAISFLSFCYQFPQNWYFC